MWYDSYATVNYPVVTKNVYTGISRRLLYMAAWGFQEMGVSFLESVLVANIERLKSAIQSL